MKTTFLAVFLTGSVLGAQTPAFAPLPPGAAAGANRGTNADQLLQQALHSAVGQASNAQPSGKASVPTVPNISGTGAVPANASAAADWSALPSDVAPAKASDAPATPPLGNTNAQPSPQAEVHPVATGSTSAVPSNPVQAAASTQPSVVPPAPAALPSRDTNRQQRLQEMMRRAAASRTNAAPPAFPGSPATTIPVPGVAPAATTALPPGATAPAASITPAPGAGMTGSPAAAPSSPPGATPQSLEEPLPQGMIDFRSADLTQVLDIYSMMVNRTVLRAATLPAPTITLTTRGQLTVREGIQALEAVLALNGITMVSIGDKFVKAVPEAQGGSTGAAFDTNSPALMPEMGQYVTHVVQLKYAKPSEMTAVLQPFVKIPNGILPIDGSQMLVLRDYTENVKRMLELIAKIDVAVPSEYVSEVIPIKYAQASEIAGALNSLSTGGTGATVGASTSGSSRTTRSAGTMNRPGTMGGYPGQTTPGMVTPPGSAGTPTPAAGSSFSQRLQNLIGKAAQQGDIVVLGQTKIISDERTNSLLIYASKEDMKTIKEIVAKLDVVLAQVLIEAVIIEVTLTDSRDLGFSYLQHPQSSGQWTGVGAINNKNFLNRESFVSGGTNSLIPQGFSYLMNWGQDLDVTVTALAADSRARILQRPRIQTSHNEPASLFVGESRPYPTSSYYGGGAYGGYSSIQQLQIGVTLDVTPLINPDGLVVMEIRQQIDSFLGNVTIQNVGDVPVTSSKVASTKVSVRDHDTIILGGLIETDKNKSASGVPFLKDVPLLGYLFRSTHADETRKELLVLIRPTVLPTPEIAALAATAEKNKMPGVRATEKELRADEMHRLKKADKAEQAENKGNF
ncbi:MAG TPA: secretin N-terminal domain-containing protein [Candidatus Paceibacterota bacterium]|nr:secretin N-terminal domain-containing protein [Verrucomicrobiota bacterium]HSA09051.1 secretin N-terminal domain-containing protein [Candidatus Paceibacterota bacterium]